MAKKRLKTNLPHPYISVVVFSRPNESPSKALNALKHIQSPKNLYEIIIIKGSHLSKQRNIAIQEANGKIVYLLDNDSQVQPLALSIIQQAFTNTKIAAVGGPSISPVNETTYLSKLIGYILETHFGALRMRLRYSKTAKKRTADEFHLIGANLALRKKTVLQSGGFNEKITPNEETELLSRMKRKGYSLSYIPQLFVFRSHRKTLLSLWKQFFFYGRGRAMQLEKTHSVKDIIFIFPILFLFYLLGLLLLYNKPFYDFLLICYILLALATAGKAAIKYRRSDIFVVMPFIFPIIHISYAVGIFTETLKIVARHLRISKMPTGIMFSEARVRNRNNMLRK